MSEKNLRERQFQQNEAAPKPEKSKLEGMQASELVPAA